MSTPSRKPQFHEDLRRNEARSGPTDRAFGLTVGPILALLSLRPLLEGRAPWWILTAIGAALAAAALAAPRILGPLNRAWMALGDLLGRIVGPIVLAIIFYLAVTPTGWLLRLAGKDAMRRRSDRALESYWLPRRPPGPAPDTMANQF